MSDAYEKVKGGRLTFKGGTLASTSKSIHKKKKKRRKSTTNHPPISSKKSSPETPPLLRQNTAALSPAWGENLTYYTGIGYLGGAIIGR
ncbi:hypothetical protein HanOQP8_Chr10g0357061 [Helianthus annuus]|nr:hypothetical protein HanOQP8_Chr10g0357061 [Helianthus annuus]KAJ0882854.1 hypothetical protein HanPSC8_Chr10g0414481 [Helianthus annuus]